MEAKDLRENDKSEEEDKGKAKRKEWKKPTLKKRKEVARVTEAGIGSGNDGSPSADES
jgi:hypothetical protein